MSSTTQIQAGNIRLDTGLNTWQVVGNVGAISAKNIAGPPTKVEVTFKPVVSVDKDDILFAMILDVTLGGLIGAYTYQVNNDGTIVLTLEVTVGNTYSINWTVMGLNNLGGQQSGVIV